MSYGVIFVNEERFLVSSRTLNNFTWNLHSKLTLAPLCKLRLFDVLQKKFPGNIYMSLSTTPLKSFQKFPRYYQTFWDPRYLATSDQFHPILTPSSANMLP